MNSTEKYRNNSIQLLKDTDNFNHLPINLENITTHFNIQLSYKYLGENSGIIDYNKKTKETNIIINNKENSFRQRFSLAHEIAHYIYDINFDKDFHLEEQVFNRNSKFHLREKIADKYAEQLLMPSKLFTASLIKERDLLFKNKDNFSAYNIYETIKNLKEKIKVNIPAIIIRLYSLEMISYDMKSKLFDIHNNRY